MSFMTVLEKIGSDIVSVFKKAEPIVNELQVIATPFENTYAPGLSTLVTAGITAIENAEALGVAAGNTTGSNSVKLATVISSLATTLGPTLTALGVNPSTVTTAQYTTFVNSLVAAANAFVTTQAVVTPTTPVVAQVSAPITGAAVVAGTPNA